MLDYYTHQEAKMALDSAKKQEIVAKYGRSESDTGSSEVQIALLTTRIAELTEHLKVFKKDHACIKESTQRPAHGQATLA